MAKIVGEEQLRRVKEAVDLVEIMADYAPPQKAGAQFKVCCPFHQERTPSCYIYPDQQTYHCFGCGAHGDVITLVREQEGLDFVDAVEFLARRAHIELVYEERSGADDARKRSLREQQLAAMTFAQDFYQRMLWSDQGAAEARSYLEGRGIDRALAEQFCLGWSPGRGALCTAARQKGFSPEILTACNLAVDREGRVSDRFYERIMFPICDRFGQPLAFSGRILPAAEQRAKEEGRGVGKYINSSETPLYSKSDVVWNLHRARAAARKEGRLIIMEGPTDVMAAARQGFHACVAVLGTALTPAHARQMANVLGGDGRVVMLFDGDSAGQNNALKAVATCLSCAVPCRVAVMPAGQDPAELLTAGGSAALEAVLTHDRSDIDHLLRTVAPLPHAMEPRARVAAMDRCLAALRPISDEDLRRAYMEEVAAWFTVEIARLQRRLSDERVHPDAQPVVPTRPAHQDGPEAVEEDVILHLLVRYPELRGYAFDELELEPHVFPQPWLQVVDMMMEQPDMPPSDLLLQEIIRNSDILHRAVHRWLRDDQVRGALRMEDPKALLRDHVYAVQRAALEGELADLDSQIKAAQREGDHRGAMGLFVRLAELKARQRTLGRVPPEESE